MTESHIHYLYTDKPGSQILPASEKHSQKSNISYKDTGR